MTGIDESDDEGYMNATDPKMKKQHNKKDKNDVLKYDSAFPNCEDLMEKTRAYFFENDDILTAYKGKMVEMLKDRMSVIKIIRNNRFLTIQKLYMQECINIQNVYTNQKDSIREKYISELLERKRMLLESKDIRLSDIRTYDIHSVERSQRKLSHKRYFSLLEEQNKKNTLNTQNDNDDISVVKQSSKQPFYVNKDLRINKKSSMGPPISYVLEDSEIKEDLDAIKKTKTKLQLSCQSLNSK